MSKLKLLPILLCGLALCTAAHAQNDAPPASPVMREVSPGIYEIGQIHLDQKARTVTFPAVLNMNDGNLEYLLVTEQGNTHESLLVSDVSPSDLHFAMLLLGAKGSGQHDGDMPPAQIDSKFLKTAPKMKGDNVSITLRWKAGDAEKSSPAEDLITNTETKKPMERGPWIYNGSMFNDGHFLAQIEGAHASLVTYPAALINNPRKGNDNDQIWMVNTKAIPAVKTPVDVTITLLSNPDAKPKTP
ncbi:MAG TPA: YdjY domain-containing protein [Chthoniobacter sp.]|nr:YdjY domain-containing protein [Chthoniobacter sp.]